MIDVDGCLKVFARVLDRYRLCLFCRYNFWQLTFTCQPVSILRGQLKAIAHISLRSEFSLLFKVGDTDKFVIHCDRPPLILCIDKFNKSFGPGLPSDRKACASDDNLLKVYPE